MEILCQKFEIDRLEQYSRKENVRIYGIPERDGQYTDEIVLNKGVQMKKEDISVRQRLPIERDSGKPRGIIAKFVRIETKANIMKNMQLRQSRVHADIYVSEDLT